MSVPRLSIWAEIALICAGCEARANYYYCRTIFYYSPDLSHRLMPSFARLESAFGLVRFCRCFGRELWSQVGRKGARFFVPARFGRSIVYLLWRQNLDLPVCSAFAVVERKECHDFELPTGLTEKSRL